jgi:hypothetical protein
MDGRFKQPLLNIEITYKTTENTQETIQGKLCMEVGQGKCICPEKP